MRDFKNVALKLGLLNRATTLICVHGLPNMATNGTHASLCRFGRRGDPLVIWARKGGSELASENTQRLRTLTASSML